MRRKFQIPKVDYEVFSLNLTECPPSSRLFQTKVNIMSESETYETFLNREYFPECFSSEDQHSQTLYLGAPYFPSINFEKLSYFQEKK